MALLLAAIVGLIALIIAPGYFFYFDVTPKVAVLLVGTAAALLVWAMRRASALRQVPSWFGLLLLGSALSLALSAVFSTKPPLSWFGSNWRRFGAIEQCTVLLLAWLVAANIANHPDRVATILRAVSAAGLLTGIYGILQYFGIDPLLPAAAYHVGQGIWTIVRPPGTFGYVSYFANWLAMATFFSLALAQLEKRPALRSAAYASAAVAAFAMLLTGTRGALLGTAAGSAVLLFSRSVRVTRRTVAVAGVLVSAAIAFYLSPAGWNLHSRARWFLEDPRGGARLELWRDSIAMSLHRLPAGFGPEVFTAQFPHFESKRLAEAYPDFAHESPHNIFLDALVGQGIPGMALLVALCALALTRVRSRWLAAALVAGIVAQQFTAFTIPTAVLFFIALALSAVSPSAPEAVKERAANSRPARRLITAVPVAAALLYVAFRFAVADHSLELARRSIESGNGAAAAADYAAFDRRRLPGVSSDLWYSRAMSALSHSTPDKLQRIRTAAQAGYAALRATNTAEDPFNAWYHVATLYASTNDALDAERSLRAAMTAHPNWFKPHWMLARVLLLEGRRDEARREAGLALELDGGKHKEVIETLQGCSRPPASSAP